APKQGGFLARGLDEKARMVRCLGAARGSYRRHSGPRSFVATDLLRLPHRLRILGLYPSAMEKLWNRHRHAQFCRSVLLGQMAGETAISCIERRGCISLNVRFGSLADICSAKRHVRFTPKIRHVQCTSRCLLWAKSGHWRQSKALRKIKSTVLQKCYFGRVWSRNTFTAETDTRVHCGLKQRCFLARTGVGARKIDCRRLRYFSERFRPVGAFATALHAEGRHCRECGGSGHWSSARYGSARRR